MSPSKLLCALLLPPALAACGGGTTSQQRQAVTLFAAASTAKVMAAEIAAFERAHPDVSVQGDYEGTQSLLVKLQADPASADVLLSADLKHMQTALRDHLVGPSRVLARNRLVIAVPADDPAHITKLADLGRANVRVVLADTSVPAGAYAQQAFATAESSGEVPKGFAQAVAANTVSRESDVEQVVSKVASGEVDAGIVYATDAQGDSRIRAVQIAQADQPDTQYPIAVTLESHATAAATQFVDFLFSAQGQRILRDAGFAVTTP